MAPARLKSSCRIAVALLSTVVAFGASPVSPVGVAQAKVEKTKETKEKPFRGDGRKNH